MATFAEMGNLPVKRVEIEGFGVVNIYGLSLETREALSAKTPPKDASVRQVVEYIVDVVYAAVNPGMPDATKEQMMNVDWFNPPAAKLYAAVLEVVEGEPFRGRATSGGGKRQRKNRLGADIRPVDDGVQDGAESNHKVDANSNSQPI